MKFIPRQPREGINVSETHPLMEAGFLVAGLAAIFFGIVLFLVFLLEIVLLFVPPETETSLFSEFLPDDLVAVASDDARLENTRALLERLAAHLELSGLALRLEITDADSPNAMAFPGGLIVVTSALLDAAESENELAFVLGHELGHFNNRDHLRRLGRASLVAIVFSALVGGESGSGFGLTIARLTELSFDRGQERDADEFGLQLVNAEFGHVAESWRFFERLEQEGADDALAYLSTHPSASSRIADLKSIAAASDWSTEGDVTPLP